MKIKVLILAGTLLAIPACAPTGAGLSVKSLAHGENLSSAHSSGVPAVAVSRWGTGRQIFLLDASYHLIKTITQKYGPTGGGALAFDRSGNLYDADSGGPYPWGQNVLVFTPPYNLPPETTIAIPHHVASDVVVDSKTGVFAVLANAAEMNDDPEVLFFRRVTTKPCAIVSLANGTVLSGESFDAESVLFFTQVVGADLNLVSVSGECEPKSPVTYAPSLSTLDGGPYFNTSDQIVFNKGFYGTVYTYAHPAKGVLGKLLETTLLNEPHGSYVGMAGFSTDGKSLFAIPDKGNVEYLYDYPSGGNYTKEIALPAQASSTAVNPPLVP